MAGYESHESPLSLPCDSCHAPCGWAPPACQHEPHDCTEPCPPVLAHEAEHLADRAFFCVMGFPPPYVLRCRT